MTYTGTTWRAMKVVIEVDANSLAEADTIAAADYRASNQHVTEPLGQVEWFTPITTGATMKQFTKKQDESVGGYQSSVAEAAEYLADLADDAEAYFDEKSEKWQESDAGAAYLDWKDSLRTAADSLSTASDDLGNVSSSPSA